MRWNIFAVVGAVEWICIEDLLAIRHRDQQNEDYQRTQKPNSRRISGMRYNFLSLRP